MSKLRKTKNNKLILVLPMVLVVSFGVLLTYSFANFKSIKLFDAVGGFFLGNEYTLSYDVANCTNKTIKNGKTFGELCVPATPDGYTFDGWYYNNELIETTTQVHTNQNIQLLAHFTQTFTCSVGDVYDFDYNGTNGIDGSIQEFIAHCPGNYKLETWGAQGGSINTSYYGGYGAYSVGEVMLNSNDTLYIAVGGKGNIISAVNKSRSAVAGGYNGGGNARLYYDDTNTTRYGGSGGGATHIGLENELLKNTASSNVLMVAGGGGGAGGYNGGSPDYYIGGSGGGMSGVSGANVDTTAGTQTGPGHSAYGATAGLGAFGQGGSAHDGTDIVLGGAGGGGYYGGGAVDYSASSSGAGGSGYIGNSNLSNKHMTCYNCTTNNNVDTKTISNTCHNANPTVDCSKEGNGYARITYLGNTTEFAYTGNYQKFTAPMDGIYQVELWGAQGGSSRHVDATGLGGYTKGSVYLTANQKLYLYIGQKGEDGGTVNKSPQASFNGGGAGGNSNGSVSSGTYYVSGSGGGATDIRFFGSSSPSSSNLTWNSNLGLNSRVMVAGGGGGSGYLYINDSTWSGAPSGGLIGYDSGEAGGASHLAGATGATQSTGGITSQNLTYGSYSWTKGNNGTFGVGANSVVNGHPGGGGGGGYYGGASGGSGGGSCGGAGGSGGSSYISGHAGSIAIAEGATNNPRTIKTGCGASSTDVECSKHYSGIYFTDTVMIDGSGYNWTTTKGSLVSQPQPDGTTATGHSGNGYARITYLGVPVTVTFNALDGNVSESTRSVIKNSQIGTLPIPTNGDYAFNGWYLDSEYTNEVSSSYVVTENITLYAKWDLNKLYLYRNGNISTLVGSFTQVEGHGQSYEKNPSVTYADTYIRISSGAGNTNNYAVALVSTNKINTTGYSKLCVTATHNGSGCNFNHGHYAYGISTGNSSISSGYVQHLNGMAASAENTQCVDISSYNSNYYLMIGNSYSGYSDFSEVWLEK